MYKQKHLYVTMLYPSPSIVLLQSHLIFYSFSSFQKLLFNSNDVLPLFKD